MDSPQEVKDLTKRKRPERNTSSSSGDTSSLTLAAKRVKEDEITTSNVSFFLENSVLKSPQVIQDSPLSISSAPVLTSTPVSNSSTMATNTEPASGAMDKIISSMDTMLENKMTEHKNILINEMKATLEKEIGALKTHYDREIDDLKDEVHTLSVQNKSLSEKADKLWSERQATMANINNVRVANVITAQYTRRANIIVHGVPEAAGNDQEDCNNVVRSLIKDKLKVDLQRCYIEVCHRLGGLTLNKKRPMVVRFRFRDTKWDLMKMRKNLKGTGIGFAEDLCPEIRTLHKEVKEDPPVVDSWAWNGKLFAKSTSGNVHQIQYGKNWKSMFDE